MLTILLHSSKTMRTPTGSTEPFQQPGLMDATKRLARYVQSLSPLQLEKYMSLSKSKAIQTRILWQEWSTTPERLLPAIDSFIGDIYSGLQVQTFSDDDRQYANEHLFILSGLYGVLRALDSIAPYRLEMGYKLPRKPYQNLYSYWGGMRLLGSCLPTMLS